MAWDTRLYHYRILRIGMLSWDNCEVSIASKSVRQTGRSKIVPRHRRTAAFHVGVRHASSRNVFGLVRHHRHWHVVVHVHCVPKHIGIGSHDPD